MKKREPDQLVQLKFRIPEWLRAKLASSAEDNHTTLADEIERRLARSYESIPREQFHEFLRQVSESHEAQLKQARRKK